MKKLLYVCLLFTQSNYTAETLFTNLAASNEIAGFYYVSDLIHYAHQFTAGSGAAVTTFKIKTDIQPLQFFPDAASTKIILYADSNNTLSTTLGELTYASFDSITSVATYTGSVTLPSAGTYWFEMETTSTSNHFYVGNNSTAITGSAAGWDIKKTKYGVKNLNNANTWSFFDGTNLPYPQFELLGTADAGPQTVTTLVAAVNLASSIYLYNNGTTLDLSGEKLTATGQAVLVALTGLDGSLDGITKTNITTLKLAGNSFTTIPANIFTTFPNLTTLELQGNNSLTTLNTNSFNGLSLTTLDLSGCPNLTTLPANVFNGLSVSETLNLSGNASFTTLTSGCFAGLTLTGDLLLNQNYLLATIPVNIFNGLTIGGDLNLNSNAIVTIAANTFNGLTVQGTILLGQNSSLTSIHPDAFDGATVGGTLQLNGNTLLTNIPEKIMIRFFRTTTVSGDVRLDSAGLTSLPSGVFSSIVVSDDLRLDSNPDLTTLPTHAFEKAQIGGDLRINQTGITEVPNLIFNNTQIGGNLLLSNNTDLRKIAPQALQGLRVVNIDLGSTPALTRIPFCVFDTVELTGTVMFEDSGLLDVMPNSATRTQLINGVTQPEIQQILRKNPQLTEPITMAEYAQVVKAKKKSLGLRSAQR
ncbi:MAG: leucine-rich repeat domain-containing protein [Proteobacteria bacterium]|nr:leucine-rich repeat domain-containing protein [Pseudomonadota bacterium]NBP16521.1 leucine-rich repeat domain-containing protein [bacterium]